MDMATDRVRAVIGNGATGNPVADFLVNSVIDVLAEVDFRDLAGRCEKAAESLLGTGAAAHGAIEGDLVPGAVERRVSSASQQVAAELLFGLGSQTRFRYDVTADPVVQLLYGVDALINDLVVEAVIGGLKSCLESGRISPSECRSIGGMLANSGNGRAVNGIYYQAIRRAVLETGERRIHLISVGCGRGNNDADIYRALRNDHPEIDIRLVGFDAHQSVDENPIATECGGIVINRELAPGQTYLDLLRECEGGPIRCAVATERYALHHMNRTLETLLADLEDIALVSVDHPVEAATNASLSARAAMAAYDLLSAQIRTAASGGGWIPAAMKDPKVFSILYRRADHVRQDLASGVSVAEVGNKVPPTWVMSYPEAWRTSLPLAAE